MEGAEGGAGVSILTCHRIRSHCIDVRVENRCRRRGALPGDGEYGLFAQRHLGNTLLPAYVEKREE
jgi:hypothetical protein